GRFTPDSAYHRGRWFSPGERKRRMRELFEEVIGHSPLDPQEAARRSTRAPQRKRIYKDAGIAADEGCFSLTLDSRPYRAPPGRIVTVTNGEIAQAIAREWQAQGETIDPLTMPLTRFANSVIEAVVGRADLVVDDMAKYLQSDLLCYRAAHPE